MNNLGTALLKMTMLAGGAVIGMFLARLYDEALTRRAEEQSDRDKTHYAQGLSALQEEQQQ